MLFSIKVKYKLWNMAAICTKEAKPAHPVDIMSQIVPSCQHLHVPFQKFHSQVFEVKDGVPSDTQNKHLCHICIPCN
jgi:hypothetical protein